MAARTDRLSPEHVRRELDGRGARTQPVNGRGVVWIALALGAVAAVAAVGFNRLPGEMRDFEVYWTAATRVVEGEPLYRSEDGHYQFKYLPAFAVLAAPAAALSLGPAKAAWFVLSVALLPCLIWLSVQILPLRRRPSWAVALIVIVAMGKFYGHELVLGQVNILFAVLAGAAILMLRQNRDVAAAALFVVAVAVKPYAILFLPWIALVRGRAAIATVAIGSVVLALLPAALYGFDGTIQLHREWWMTVTASTAPNLTNNDNVSLAGMYAKWLGSGRAASLLTLASTVAFVMLAADVVYRGRGIHRREALEGALVLTLIPLLSPQGWDYVFLVATPAIAIFANYDDRLPAALRWTTRLAIATIGLSLFDVMGRERYAAFMSWSIITICFIVLAVALAALRHRRVA